MQYQAIPPTPRPTKSDAAFLGRSQESISLPCVDLVSTLTSKVKQDSESNLRWLRTLEIPRLSQNPIKLRHNGDTIDIELSIDQYGANVWQDLPESQFPPANALEFPESVEYFRSTTLYCFADVSVFPASSKVWDGRSTLAVSKLSTISVDPSSKLDFVRNHVRDTILQVKTPAFVVSLEGYGKTTVLPPVSQNRNELDDAINRFLEKHYNALAIPESPLEFGDALGLSSPVTLGSTQSVSIAAQLQSYEFIQWVLASV